MAGNNFAKKGMYEKQIAVSYLQKRFKSVLWYLFVTAVFFGFAVIYEYRQMYRNMQYAVVITLFFGALSALWDYFGYRKHCMELFGAVEKEEERMLFLPEAESVPEKLYQQMMAEQEREKRKLREAYDQKKKDMTDYYTLWTHQIKTPIAALNLLLQDREAESGGEKESRREQEELFKIEQYAQMALYYARLESISSDLLFKYCDIRGVCVRAVQKYAVLFLHSGLKFQLEEFELRAVTDEKWLAFVIEQVLSNALKYTASGGIAIYGSDGEGNRREGRVHYMTIADTGAGIRESDLPRIFERGFTGYNGRTGQKSTGIGLYLCKEILKELSHTICVKSVWEEGTRVILGFEQEDF
ncbi:MAG: sensor histidine kinase [Lachnospiraceae bacterium]|nr:sensor histidine kinase [Lachnospiraceae bacterium]